MLGKLRIFESFTFQLVSLSSHAGVFSNPSEYARDNREASDESRKERSS